MAHINDALITTYLLKKDNSNSGRNRTIEVISSLYNRQLLFLFSDSSSDIKLTCVIRVSSSFPCDVVNGVFRQILVFVIRCLVPRPAVS